MGATFQSLAPELLIRVLELGPDDFAMRRASLLSHALVSRAWRAPSQHLLWDEIELHSRSAIERMLASPALGAFRTRVVRVSNDFKPGKPSVSTASDEPVDGYFVEIALRCLKGVSALVLEEVDGLAVSNLRLQSLEDLRHLHIDMAFDRDPSAVAARDTPTDAEFVPFRLASLTLSGYDELAPFILPTFQSEYLTDLRLAFEDSGATNALIHASFPLVARSLRRLSLGFCTSAFLPLLQQCTNLTEISAQWEELENVLPALATGVRLQRVEVFIRPWYPRSARTGLLGVLEKALTDTRLRSCCSLRVSGYRQADWRKPEGMRFQSLCEARRIRVEV